MQGFQMTGALGSPKKIACGRGVVKLDYKRKKKNLQQFVEKMQYRVGGEVKQENLTNLVDNGQVTKARRFRN